MVTCSANLVLNELVKLTLHDDQRGRIESFEENTAFLVMAWFTKPQVHVQRVVWINFVAEIGTDVNT